MTKTQLRALSIFNEWDLAKTQPEPQVCIIYRSQRTGRASCSAAWQILRPGYQTDPKGHWTNSYNKTFWCYNTGEDKEPQRLSAIAWATERYDITEWERSPFGSYHPKGTMKALEGRAK